MNEPTQDADEFRAQLADQLTDAALAFAQVEGEKFRPPSIAGNVARRMKERTIAVARSLRAGGSGT